MYPVSFKVYVVRLTINCTFIYSTISQNGSLATYISLNTCYQNLLKTICFTNVKAIRKHLLCITFSSFFRANWIANMPTVFFKKFIEIMTKLNHTNNLIIWFTNINELFTSNPIFRNGFYIFTSFIKFQLFFYVFHTFYSPAIIELNGTSLPFLRIPMD